MKQLALAALIIFTAFSELVKGQVLLSENFESGTLPQGWSRSHDPGSKGWEFGNSTQMSSQFLAIPPHTRFAISNDDKHDNSTLIQNKAFRDYLITPPINVASRPYIFLKFKAFFSGISGSQAYIRISNDNGASWSMIQQLAPGNSWREIILNISQATVNNSTILLAFHHDDNNKWADGFAIDDVMVFEPHTFDLACTNITIPKNVEKAPTIISGTIYNNGGAPISSFDLNYQVNNGAIVTENVGGFTINSLSSYTFSHSIPWTPATNGNHTLKAWASSPNGSSDMDFSNDTGKATVYVSNYLAPRKVLLEQFTSNNSSTCESNAPSFYNFLDAVDANSSNSDLAAISYHQDFPSPGNDSAFTLEGLVRRQYYQINNIGMLVLGGNSYTGPTSNFTYANFQNLTGRKSLFEINLEAGYKPNGTVTASGNFTVLADIPSGYRFYIAIVEDEISKAEFSAFNSGTTSQPEFRNVFRRMFPNENGLNISAQSEGFSRDFAYNYKFASNPRIFSSIQKLTAVAFIQHHSTKEIMQAMAVPVNISYANVDENPEILERLFIFPNPANAQANIAFSLSEPQRITMKVIDIMGRLVVTEELGHLTEGMHQASIRTEALPIGVYSIYLTSERGKASAIQKLLISR
jgi:hypothetical protein